MKTDYTSERERSPARTAGTCVEVRTANRRAPDVPAGRTFRQGTARVRRSGEPVAPGTRPAQPLHLSRPAMPATSISGLDSRDFAATTIGPGANWPIEPPSKFDQFITIDFLKRRTAGADSGAGSGEPIGYRSGCISERLATR